MARRKEFLESVLDQFYIVGNEKGIMITGIAKYDAETNKIRIYENKHNKFLNDALKNYSDLISLESTNGHYLLNNLNQRQWKSDPVLLVRPETKYSQKQWSSLSRAKPILYNTIETPVISVNQLPDLLKERDIEGEDYHLDLYRLNIEKNKLRTEFRDTLNNRLQDPKLEDFEKRETFQKLSIQD